jgi:hypothetical protein
MNLANCRGIVQKKAKNERTNERTNEPKNEVGKEVEQREKSYKESLGA